MAHQHLGLAEIQELVGRGELFDTLLVFRTIPSTGQVSTPRLVNYVS